MMRKSAVILWLLANLFDTLTTLVGLARGHGELNPVAGVLGINVMFIIKWSVVLTLIWLVWASRHSWRLHFVLTRTVGISTVIVWLGVGWNLIVLFRGGL